MKKIFKKVPAYAVISLVLIVTVAVSILAATTVLDLNNDAKIDDEDVKLVMNSVVDKSEGALSDKTLADYDANGELNVLDVIALKKVIFANANINDGFTKGIY